MYNILTIGYDCSPAAALRNMKKRSTALPFDWIVSNINSIEKCFANNFAKFHTNLKLVQNNQRLIDEYGFLFPHDYPLNNMNMNDISNNNNNLGEGVFGEELGKTIRSNWNEYYITVKEKYDRRIERFLNIVNSNKPIIVLCRYSTDQVFYLRELFVKYYNKSNIFFINSSQQVYSDENIYNIYTEQNGEWNEENIWRSKFEEVCGRINS